MISNRYYLQFRGLIRTLAALVLLLAGSITATAACESITTGDQTGQLGVAFTVTIQVTGGNPRSFNALNLPAGLTVDTNTGVISGTPTTAGTSSVTLQATYNGACGTISKIVTFTINPPSFVGFRLPDFLTVRRDDQQPEANASDGC